MSKAVLISIRPKWCELIASGKKTIEVRKTVPKIELPFRCYIYCTNGSPFLNRHNGEIYLEQKDIIGGRGLGIYERLSGKVIGEFVCDRIFPITVEENGPFSEERGGGYSEGYSDQGFYDCLTEEEFDAYLNGKPGYGWRISGLKIYDKPKKLSEFHSCSFCDYRGVCPDGSWCQPLKCPPQSWCYVEELA